MRTLGLDYGDKTIGVAVSDGFGWTAQGVEVIKRTTDTEYKKSILKIAEWIKEYEVDTIVLGYPKNMNNSIGKKMWKNENISKTSGKGISQYYCYTLGRKNEHHGGRKKSFGGRYESQKKKKCNR